MGTTLDEQIMYKKETDYGTAVTPDTAVEYIGEDLDYIIERNQGMGMRTGLIAPRADRDVPVKYDASGSFTTELYNKGNGKLVEAALGSGASNQITGAAYQQLFTPTTSDYLPSYTIQKGIPLLGGSTSAMTFDGMVCSGFELTAPNAGVPTVKWNWVGRSLATDTSLASASYATGLAPFSFVHGSITVGGTITVPTTTALGSSSGDASANIREATVNWDNALDPNGFNHGGGGKRVRKSALGRRMLSGNLVVEYDSNTLRDAWLAGTSLGFILTFQDTTTAIAGSNYPTFQIVVPVIRLKGELPKSNGGEIVTQSIDFEWKDGGVAASPLYVAIVTAETAI